jgi:uncharacterized protein (DUF302 family)
MTNGLSTKLEVAFDEAVERTTQALAEQGFGLLTTIDVAATLKEKLGEDMEKYLILGACNPGLAHRALDIDRQLGQLLPCNVVVRADPADPEGTVLIEAMDPQVMVQVAGQAQALQAVADEAWAKIHAAIEGIAQTAKA